jgi:predicted transcriptional regulator YheO
VHLTKQQALNYAETLKSAIEDVNMFRNARQNKEERAIITKLAEQGDCE